VEYSISNLWFASFEIQNLLNSNVMVWNNYKERGQNFQFNLTYKF
jgi:outer membrane cobalamin receptor